jgi:glycosyltransferase involved in cell wall biosynthesis
MSRGDIICIGNPAWDGDYAKSTVQLLSELAHDYRILYVDYQYTVKDIVTTIFGKQHAPIKRMLGISHRLRTLQLDNYAAISVLTPPPIIPANWIKNESLYHSIQYINAKIILSSIRNAMKKMEITNPIVINAFNPSLGIHLVNNLDESLLTYYCYDNISAAGWLGRHGAQSEKKFAKMTDCIVTSSDELKNRFREHHEKVFVVKNGVDFQLMKKGFSSVEQKLQRTIGYVGSIDDRLDYDLLDHVIGSMQEHRFQFIGRATQEKFLDRLKIHGNVELLGAHPVTFLPNFLREMDVCIIPFSKNEFNRSVYPLKVNEYLAAGKPIVMTPFAELPEFNGIVHTAETKEEFSAAITLAYSSDSDEQRMLRRDFAQYHSWSHRAKEFAAHIDSVPHKQRNGAK